MHWQQLALCGRLCFVHAAATDATLATRTTCTAPCAPTRYSFSITTAAVVAPVPTHPYASASETASTSSFPTLHAPIASIITPKPAATSVATALPATITSTTATATATAAETAAPAS